jgi:hypothetical protein
MQDCAQTSSSAYRKNGSYTILQIRQPMQNLPRMIACAIRLLDLTLALLREEELFCTPLRARFTGWES